jgi:hypothetical protein
MDAQEFINMDGQDEQDDQLVRNFWAVASEYDDDPDRDRETENRNRTRQWVAEFRASGIWPILHTCLYPHPRRRPPSRFTATVH